MPESQTHLNLSNSVDAKLANALTEYFSVGPEEFRLDDILRRADANGQDAGTSANKNTPRCLGADSLDVIEFRLLIETRFFIEIPDGDCDRLMTVADWRNYLRQRCNGAFVSNGA